MFDVEPGEGRLVVLMLACSFLVGTGTTLAGTAAYTLFLSRFGGQGLPYVYLAVSLAITLSSFTYLRLSDRLSPMRLVIVAAAFVLLVLAGARLGLSLTTAVWLAFALPIVSELAYSLTNIAFWNLAGELFDLQQAKRLFGLIAGGRELAKMVGGLVIAPLVLWLGTPNLFLAAAICVALLLGLILYIARSFAVSLRAPAPEKQPSAGARPNPGWWRSPYVLLVLGLFAASMITLCTLDILFYGQAERQFAGEVRLASFLGLFAGAVGLLNLLAHSFLTAPLLKRFGIRGSLLLVPLLLLANAVLVVAVSPAAGAIALSFWSVVAMRLLLDVLVSSVAVPVQNILYQPLPAPQRLKIQALSEVVFSVSIGLSGATLLAVTALGEGGPGPLSYVVLVLVVAWAVVSVLVRREYPRRLTQALARRRLGAAGPVLADGSTQAILERELQSPFPGVVSYALTLLEGMNRERAVSCLESVLDHPAPEVRQDVLQRIERLGVTGALPAVRRRLAHEPSPAVRGTALRTLAALSGPQAFGHLAPYLDDPSLEVRQGAMVGLLRSGGPDGLLAARSSLLELVASSRPADRVLAAQTLGEVGMDSLCEPLLPLLSDENVRVRQAALRAAGQIGSARLWPLVVEALHSRGVRGAASSALASGGDAGLPALFACFDAAAGQPHTQQRLASACGRVGGTRAVAWLQDHLAHPDTSVRTQFLHALDRCGYRALAGDVDRVVRQIREEAALAAGISATQADIGRDDSMDLLNSALNQLLAGCRSRIFLLLSFLYDRKSIRQASDNLSLASAGKRAYALEVLDVLVPPDLKRLFFPLLSGLPAEQIAQQLRAQFPQRQMGCRQRLEEIIYSAPGRLGAWTQACALYAAGRSPDVAPSTAVAEVTASPDRLVREMALWAASRLSTPPAVHDAAPAQLRRAAHNARGDRLGEKSMLTTVEKVIALRRAPVFAEVPDEILAELAPCLEEMEYAAGQAIFSQGELGDCMYIIADGKVRIHDGDHTLNDLCAGDVFGEMAVLDAEPRSASATAGVDSLLLRLDQQSLYEVMQDQFEVGRGIVRMLTRRLRARMDDLRQLRSQPET